MEAKVSTFRARPRDANSARPGLIGSTILLVEDDNDTASLLTLVLEDAGAGVRHAATASEAAGLLGALLPQGRAHAASADVQRIDLIVLDLRLSDGDGADTLLQLKRAGYRLPPVVVMSAAARPTVEAAARRLSADGIVYKPFALKTLLDCISNVLEPG